MNAMRALGGTCSCTSGQSDSGQSLRHARAGSVARAGARWHGRASRHSSSKFLKKISRAHLSHATSAGGVDFRNIILKTAKLRRFPKCRAGDRDVALDADDTKSARGGLLDGIPERWQVVGATFLAFILCNMDKVNMSVAVIPMAQELGWSATEKGLVSSSFFWGYTLTQIPGGLVAKKLGGKFTLSAGVLLWSFATILAPHAAWNSMAALCISRFFVGLGEGVAPPAATALIGQWVPASERSRAVSLVWGGLNVGSVAGLLISPWVIKLWGWPGVFWLFGLLGFVWESLWRKVGTSADQSSGRHTLSGKFDEIREALIGVPWTVLFRCRPLWAITFAHWAHNWSFYTLLAWLPSYFNDALGFDVAGSSLVSIIPYVGMVLMAAISGPTADSLIAKGWPITRVRKTCQTVAFMGPALCMITCAIMTDKAQALGPMSAFTWPLIAMVTAAVSLSVWSLSGLYCNHQDINQKYASTMMGITNTAGALPGAIGVAAVGVILDSTNSWALALFIPAIFFQITGTIVYLALGSSEPIDFDAQIN